MTGYSKLTLSRAKALRRNLTEAERKLWPVLRAGQLGAKFRKQQPIGPFIADFCCQSHRLIIELDGSQHAENKHDARRDAFLAGRGYRVLRFWNNDVLSSVDGVVAAIVASLDLPSPSHRPAAGPSLSLDGRGEAGATHG